MVGKQKKINPEKVERGKYMNLEREFENLGSMMRLQEIIDEYFAIYENNKKYLSCKDIRTKLREALDEATRALALHKAISKEVALDERQKTLFSNYENSVYNLIIAFKAEIIIEEEKEKIKIKVM